MEYGSVIVTRSLTLKHDSVGKNSSGQRHQVRHRGPRKVGGKGVGLHRLPTGDPSQFADTNPSRGYPSPFTARRFGKAQLGGVKP
jgi:hypothetical protein